MICKSTVYNKSGSIIGFINRDHEFDREEPEIGVELTCGFYVSFWIQGLDDREYIKRAKAIKKLEAVSNK